MNNPSIHHQLAEEMLRVFPILGRLIALMAREAGEEETSMMQITVLFHLENNPITTSDLAKKRRVSLQAASALVQNLVERGWIIRTPDPHDRRQWLLQITPEGLARAQAAKAQAANYLASLLETLSAEETQAAEIFLPALHRILLEQMDGGNPKQTSQDIPPEEQPPL